MKVIRSFPLEGKYFEEAVLEAGTGYQGVERGTVNVYEECAYQEMLGFGGAFTESTAYNYSLMTKEQKEEFLTRYFDREKGLGYTFCRTHIHACDFSLSPYTYVEEGDMTLDTFDIERDRKYIIPLIKDAQRYTGEGLWLFASPWSPPAYMKTNNSLFEGGSLKEEMKPLWARYYVKYIRAYEAEGITISAISVQNEPKALQPWESCFYSAEDERDFIEKYLAPALDEAGLSHIKIIVWDHNKERVYERAKEIFTTPAVKERVYGVGHHWYSGDHFDGPQLVHEQFDKPVFSTEICGIISEDVVTLAEKYARELCGDFNHFTSAFCDWNMLLDENGGPFHNRNRKHTNDGKLVYENKGIGCYAPVLYHTDKGEAEYTPIYYYIGHFAKYVKNGARRVATTKFSEDVVTCAFKNPDGTLVLVVANISDTELPVAVRRDGVATPVPMPAHSIATVIF